MMVVKSSWVGFESYPRYQPDQALSSDELLIQMLLTTTEAGQLLDDSLALLLAHQQLDQRLFAGTAPRRRAIPPRRHLRNK